MKQIFLFFFFFGHSLLASDLLGEYPQAITRAFLPKGFDNNDAISILVDGRFEGKCSKVGMVNSQVDTTGKIIELELMRYEYKGDCHSLGQVFYSSVYLGLIPTEGDYSIVDKASGKSLGVLTVEDAEESLPGTDSIEYAPLTDAFILNGRTPQLVLRGAYSNTCHHLGKVHIKVQENVIVVLPTTRHERVRECAQGLFPFEAKVKLPAPTQKTPFVLHVRSSAGEAIQKMIY